MNTTMQRFPFDLPRTNSADYSPSVTLERGSYRVQQPSVRARKHRRDQGNGSQSVGQRRGNNNGYMAVLIVLLVMASMASFGAAYYLFSTRWAPQDIIHTNYATDNTTLSLFRQQANLSNTQSPTERYLTYLPHGGFHNQRIALENALTLSQILNRTLVIPPVRLGKPVHYSASDQLRFMLGQSGKEGLLHCQAVKPRPLECLDYFDYTCLPWDWFINLPNTTTSWIPLSEFRASDLDDYTLADSRLYDYRFVDALTDTNDKFGQHILLSELRSRPHQLLRLGTLFGTSRLRLQKANSRVRQEFRRAMVFTNSDMRSVAGAIARALGGYLSVHVRLSDGQFRENEHERVRHLWWAVIRDKLGFSVDKALEIERNVLHMSAIEAPITLSHARVIETGIDVPQVSNITCQGSLHSNPMHQRLNTVLFIATDIPNPRQAPAFVLFRRTFPCLFFLGDFAEELGDLNKLENPYDGLKLKSFVLPFIDALIAGLAEDVIGTKDSTFSMFVQDVLWRTAHGFDVL